MKWQNGWGERGPRWKERIGLRSLIMKIFNVNGKLMTQKFLSNSTPGRLARERDRLMYDCQDPDSTCSIRLTRHKNVNTEEGAVEQRSYVERGEGGGGGRDQKPYLSRGQRKAQLTCMIVHHCLCADDRAGWPVKVVCETKHVPAAIARRCLFVKAIRGKHCSSSPCKDNHKKYIHTLYLYIYIAYI